MKGITFTVIASIILALVGIVVLLFIFEGMSPGFTGRSMCKFYIAINTLPLPANFRPPLPEWCSIVPTTDRIVLKEITNDIMADMMVRCWDKASKGTAAQTFICYEIFVRKTGQVISEDSTNNIISERYSGILQPDKIEWKTEDIQGNDITIIIKFNAFTHKLEVI